MKSLYMWAAQQVHKPYAPLVFGFLVFIEGIFFMPVTTLFILFGLEKRESLFSYALIATLASVAGALLGYALGDLLWDAVGCKIVTWFIKPATWDHVVDLYRRYDVIAVTLASMLPFPYAALTLSGGFCQLAILPFAGAIFLGRGLRFFALAVTLTLWGTHVKDIIDRHFYIVLACGLSLVVGITWGLSFIR